MALLFGGAGRITRQMTAATLVDPVDRKAPLLPQMANAMVSLRRVFGTCYGRDLISIGFTQAELDDLGIAARRRAAEIAPDLVANDDDETMSDEDVAFILDLPAPAKSKQANAVRQNGR